jgi:hypothetical protein
MFLHRNEKLISLIKMHDNRRLIAAAAVSKLRVRIKIQSPAKEEVLWEHYH